MKYLFSLAPVQFWA